MENPTGEPTASTAQLITDLDQFTLQFGLAIAEQTPPTIEPKELSPVGRAAIDEVAGRASRRTEGAIIRNSFVRDEDPKHVPPLAELAATKGRGAAVALKLYLAIQWLAGKEPYDTSLTAASWAKVLDLDEPDDKGSRRINDAITRLEGMKLIRVIPHPGSAQKILLRDERTRGKYTRPYTKGNRVGAADLYFKVPPRLWTEGHIQDMSTAALVMLLIVLEESRGKQAPQWWSQQVFDKRFAISKDVRAKGTKELEQRGLLWTKRQSLAASPGLVLSSGNRSRKQYHLIRAAADNLKPTKEAPDSSAGRSRTHTDPLH